MHKLLTSSLRSAFAGMLAISLVAGGTQGSASAQSGCTAFSETGKTVCGRFLNYWNTHGGLAQQGYPVTNEMQEQSETDGKTYTMQYFERARFEMHPENKAPFDVLLSLLGVEYYNTKYPGGAKDQMANNAAGSVLFAQTGHRVGGAFLDYWRAHGGLAQQGHPISDEFQERSDLDGNTYMVQYFERAVFELHREKKAPFNVLLSQLGTFRFHDKYGSTTPQGTGKIVFDTRNASGFEVSVINPDGTGKSKIADGRSPVFSPDGSRIAFLATVSTTGLGKIAVRTVNLDGSNPQDFCTGDANAQIDLVSYSSKDQVGINAGQSPPGDMFVCALTADSTMGSTLNIAAQRVTTVLDWLPGGTNAVWESGPSYDDLNLYYGDVAQGTPVRVTNGQNRATGFKPALYRSARVSPDGHTIAIAGSRIFFAAVPGAASTLEGKENSSLKQPTSLAWAPNGQALIAVDASNHTLNLIDFNTGKTTVLAQNVEHADWSSR